MKIERRCKRRARIELRAENGKESVIIDGYVNVTGRDSRPIPDGKGGYFIERINRGAFGKALEKAEEVRALLNHNWGREIGKTGANLTLKEDVIGLRAHAEFTDSEVINDAKAGKLRGWSFGMRNVTETRAESENGIPVRNVTGFTLDEVSLINDKMKPWYESTTVETRAGEDGEVTVELRAEEFEAEYIGFEDKKEPEKADNSKLKEMIKKYGGNI